MQQTEGGRQHKLVLLPGNDGMRRRSIAMVSRSGRPPSLRSTREQQVTRCLLSDINQKKKLQAHRRVQNVDCYKTAIVVGGGLGIDLGKSSSLFDLSPAEGTKAAGQVRHGAHGLCDFTAICVTWCRLQLADTARLSHRLCT